MGNELIISIGRQLNIPGKVDNEWMCRVIYSIAGQMGLASLWDYDEDEDTVSIQHFKERIAEIFAAYEELYPSIKFIFPENITSICEVDSSIIPPIEFHLLCHRLRHITI